MDNPDLGVLIIRLSLIGVSVVLSVTGHGREGAIVAALLVVWIGWPYLRRATIRLAARSASRRGDLWMRDAAKAQTPAWREFCRGKAAQAYDHAAQVRSQL